MQTSGIIRGCLVLACAAMLTACNAMDSMKESYAHATDVAADLEKSVGSRPFVGFNWNNGVLTSVNVTFEGVPPNATLADVAEKSRQAVAAEFKQKPQELVLAFSIQP